MSDNKKIVNRKQKSPSPSQDESGPPDERRKHIHVILGSERFHRFRQIKTKYSQNSDVDVVRFCIDEVFNALSEGNIELKSILKTQVSLLLGNEYLTSRHLVTDFNDVINEAVHQWIQQKRSEINLHHFPFRNSLSETEQQVAVVFIENQIKHERGLTFTQITTFLENFDETRLRQILNKFVQNKLLLVNHFNGTDYYYAVIP